MNSEPAIDREVRDRVRRIETRLTKIGQHLNVDVGGGRPIWDPKTKRVTIPTPNCSIGDILKVIPAQELGSDDGVDVLVGNEYLFTAFVDR